LPPSHTDATVPAYAPPHSIRSFKASHSSPEPFGAYMLAWSGWACTQIVRLNAMAPPSDINSYLMQRIAQREVCGVGDQIFSFLILLFGLTMATYAWHTLHQPQPVKLRRSSTPFISQPGSNPDTAPDGRRGWRERG
jgi:hypothetical protein